MGRLGFLVGGRRLDAAAAWAVLLLLAGATLRFVGLDKPEWVAFGVLLIGVALVPPLVARDVTATLPGELFALGAAPVLVRASGAPVPVTPFLAAAGLALLAAVVLEAYTSLEMTPRFAVVFTVVTTMAFAGAWAVAAWAADALLGTAYLQGRSDLMWDLAAASTAGVLAGAVFEAYFGYTDRLDHLRGGETGDAPGRPTAEGDERSGFRHRLAIRGLQAVLAGLTAFAVARGNWPLVVNSAVPLGVTALPAVLRREYGYPMDAGVVLWLTLAATLHAIGALGPYGWVDWYDSVTHLVSAALVAGVGYAVARAAELHTDDVSFHAAFRGAFVLLFVLAAGVVWELLEFASGSLAVLVGGEPVLTQYGAGDVATDLLFDAVGGAVVTLWSTDRFDDLARTFTGWIDVLVRRE